MASQFGNHNLSEWEGFSYIIGEGRKAIHFHVRYERWLVRRVADKGNGPVIIENPWIHIHENPSIQDVLEVVTPEIKPKSVKLNTTGAIEKLDKQIEALKN